MAIDRERFDRVRQGLAAARLDALVCRLAENVVLLSSYYPNIGSSYVVFPQEGEPSIIAPSWERHLVETTGYRDVRLFDCWQNRYPDVPTSVSRLLTQAAADLNLAGKRIGYEGSFEMVAPPRLAGEPSALSEPTRKLIAGAFQAGELVDATDVLNQLRARKTPAEIERLRLANEIACLGLRTFKEQAQPGRTEAQVAAAVEATVYGQGIGYKGARFARAWAQVMSGPNTDTAWFYPTSTDRVIQPGDLVLIEMGVVVDGYWSDLTRTVVAGGKATDRQREVYEAVAAAQAASLAAVRAGASGVEVDRAGRDVLIARGLGDAFVHHTGHGIGFRYHEPIPFVAPASMHQLEVGHVHSIEPGAYIPGFGGIRKEDIAVVQGDRGEVLSTTDFGLE